MPFIFTSMNSVVSRTRKKVLPEFSERIHKLLPNEFPNDKSVFKWTSIIVHGRTAATNLFRGPTLLSLAFVSSYLFQN